MASLQVTSPSVNVEIRTGVKLKAVIIWSSHGGACFWSPVPMCVLAFSRLLCLF